MSYIIVSHGRAHLILRSVQKKSSKIREQVDEVSQEKKFWGRTRCENCGQIVVVRCEVESRYFRWFRGLLRVIEPLQRPSVENRRWCRDLQATSGMSELLSQLQKGIDRLTGSLFIFTCRHGSLRYVPLRFAKKLLGEQQHSILNLIFCLRFYWLRNPRSWLDSFFYRWVLIEYFSYFENSLDHKRCDDQNE